MAGAAVGSETIFSVGEETTPGTGVAPTRAFEVLPEDSLERTNNEIVSGAMRPSTPGTLEAAPDRVAITGHTAAGGGSIEVPTQGFGLWLKHALGKHVGSVQQGVTAAYKHTFIGGPLSGKGLTVQKALRAADGTEIAVLSYVGTKIASIEFTAEPDTILTAAFEFVSMEEVDDIDAPVPEYIDAGLFTFDGGQLVINATPVANVTSASLKVTHALNTERKFLGGGGLIDEPTDNGPLVIEGGLTAEFQDPTYYNYYRNRTPLSLELSFTGKNIASTYDEKLKFTVPYVLFRGETPKVGGTDLVMTDIPWEGRRPNSGNSITVEYTSTDVTI